MHRDRDCEQTLRRHSRQLDVPLDPAEAQELREHLARCADCRQATEQLSSTVAAMRSVAGVLHRPAGTDLTRRVLDRLAEPPPSRPRLLPAVAAAVLVSVTVGLLCLPGSPPAVASPTLEQLALPREQLQALDLDPHQLAALLASLDPRLEASRRRVVEAYARAESMLSHDVDVRGLLALYQVLGVELLDGTPAPGLSREVWSELAPALRECVAADQRREDTLREAAAAIRALAPDDPATRRRLDRLLPY